MFLDTAFICHVACVHFSSVRGSTKSVFHFSHNVNNAGRRDPRTAEYSTVIVLQVVPCDRIVWRISEMGALLG